MKSVTPTPKRTHVVYQINCKDCPATYIGQTKQYIQNRIRSHVNSIKGTSSESTALKKHAKNEKHQFDLEHYKILCTETNYKARTYLEMIHIKKDINSVNDRADCQKLGSIYNNIIGKY